MHEITTYVALPNGRKIRVRPTTLWSRIKQAAGSERDTYAARLVERNIGADRWAWTFELRPRSGSLSNHGHSMNLSGSAFHDPEIHPDGTVYIGLHGEKRRYRLT